MAERKNRSRRLLYWVVGALCVAAVCIMLIKLYWFGFSLSTQGGHYYRIDAQIGFSAAGEEPVVISVALPDFSGGFQLVPTPGLEGNFRMAGNGAGRRALLTYRPEQAGRAAVESFQFHVIPFQRKLPVEMAPPAVEGAPLVSDAAAALYREILSVEDGREIAPVAAAERLLRGIGELPTARRRILSPLPGADGMVEAARNWFLLAGFPARVARGIRLDEYSAQQSLSFLEVYIDGGWRLFRPYTGEAGGPRSLLLFQRGGESLFEVGGAENSSLHYVVTRIPVGAERLNGMLTELVAGEKLSGFSLFALSAAEQNAFKRLALLPVAILLIVILRNLIGLQTMGTFMPVLLALALLEMKLLPGLVNFFIIIGVGLVIRSWLSRLNLLMVPRIAAVVVVVILLMQFLAIAANFWGLRDFSGVTFFPLIIIAWTIERASTTWEEDGARNTLKLLGATLAAGVSCYLVLVNAELQYVLYTFSELNLVILAVILLLGTYTGYRVTELIRFRPLVRR